MIKRSYQKVKHAFTMLEVIFVIVILGIVSSIGSSLIVQIYESYITQSALQNASSKTDLAAKQIAARLATRISFSTIGKRLDGKYLKVDNVPPGEDYRILEWIGYDYDSFSATAKPGWSGFCDKDNTATTKTTYITPGSNLQTITEPILANLGATATAALNDAAIIFDSMDYGGQNYNPATMGFGTDDYLGSAPIIVTDLTLAKVDASTTTDTSIRVLDDNAKNVYTKYKLVWSAYALVPSPNADGTFDLNLHYNYQPWLGETLNNATIKTLVENVTVFKFKAVANTIRFKICVQENIGDSTVNVCKEKAVIR